MIPLKSKRIKKLAKKVKGVEEAQQLSESFQKDSEARIHFRQEEDLFDDEDVVVEFGEPKNVQNLAPALNNIDNQQPGEFFTEIQINEIKETMKLEILNEQKNFKNILQEKIKKLRKTLLFPNSILEPVQTIELENQLIGKLARQFCIYNINGVMVFNDESYSYKKRQTGHDPSEFIVKILQYLETPQYLRKALFPISSVLRNAGLLNPLDCLHHLKFSDISVYREGVILKRPTKEKDGSWADIGLAKV